MARRRRIKLDWKSWLFIVLFVAVAGTYQYYRKHRLPFTERDAALRDVEARRYADAIPRLEAYLQHAPDDVEAIAALYRCKMNISELVAELEPLATKLCQLQPDDPIPFTTRSDLYMRLGRFEEALADGLRVLELNPQEHAVRKSVMNLAAELGQHKLVETHAKILHDAGQLNREDYAAVVGLSAWRIRDLARARALITETFFEGSPNPRGQILLGLLRAEAGQHADAVPLLQAAIPKADLADRFLAWTQLADSYVQLGQEGNARKALDELAVLRDVKRHTSDAEQLPHRLDRQVIAARTLLKAKEPRKAIRLLEAAVARGLSSPELFTLLAEACQLDGDEARAAYYRELARASR